MRTMEAMRGVVVRPVLLGEAKWGKRVNGDRIRLELERKAAGLPTLAAKTRFAVCARETVDGAEDLLRVTAEDIF